MTLRKLKKNEERFFWFVVPFLLSLGFSLSWYFPHKDRLIGWGEDPFFNLWTLEHVWRKLGDLGVFHVFTPAFWDTSIFYPLPGTLALSENQIVLGILSWPLRILSGNGVFTLNLFACFMSMSAFFFSWCYFRSIGISKFAAWGALAFQACGWIQDQSAHYQNNCIFLFPLAMLSWKKWVQAPNFKRTVLCGLCFGFAAGWNIYYQVCLNIIFGFLFLNAWSSGKSKKALLTLACIVATIEFPFLAKYFELQNLIGSLKVHTGEFIEYSAKLKSLFSHSGQASLLKTLFPFFPNGSVLVESSGYIGFSWFALWLCSVKDSKARIYAVLAFFVFWVALGPQFGLMQLAKLVPGVDGMRAIGRVQVLSAFFSLTGILIFIEKQKSKWSVILFALLMIELLPGGFPRKVSIHPDLFGAPTSFEKKLGELPQTPILFSPDFNSEVQLSLSRLKMKLLNGYSGRKPLNFQLLTSLTQERVDPETIRSQLVFTQAGYFASTSPVLSESLRSQKFLKEEGCYLHHQFNICLFSVHFQKGDSPHLNQARIFLDRDAIWEYPSQKRGHLGVLKVLKEGILDYSATGRCWSKSSTSWGKYFYYTVREPMTGLWKSRVEFQKGEQVFEKFSNQWVLNFPPPFRPIRTYEVVCHPVQSN